MKEVFWIASTEGNAALTPRAFNTTMHGEATKSLEISDAFFPTLL